MTTDTALERAADEFMRVAEDAAYKRPDSWALELRNAFLAGAAFERKRMMELVIAAYWEGRMNSPSGIDAADAHIKAFLREHNLETEGKDGD